MGKMMGRGGLADGYLEGVAVDDDDVHAGSDIEGRA